jgi:sugar phosphate isomerase/epimerase
VELVVNLEAIMRGGRAVRQLADAQGVEIFAVHPTVVALPGWREHHGGLEPTIQLAQEAGAGFAIMHTPPSVSLDQGEGLVFRQRIERWKLELAGGNVQLAVENKAIRAEIHRTYTLSPLDRLCAFAHRYDLGLVLDTTHAATADEDLLHARRMFGERLVNVHLSDLGGRLAHLPVRPVSHVLGQHRFPGDGDLPLAELLVDLSASGYTGPVTLEVNPHTVRIWWPPAVRRRLSRAVEWMRRAVGDGEEGSEE